MFQHNFVVKLSVVLIAICLLKNIDFLWCWLNEFDKNFYEFRQSFSWNRRLRGWSNLVLNASFIVLKYLCYFQCSANTIPVFYSCRFILGGDQGRLRYGPPDAYSPLVECLQPKQILTVEPCFQFGELTKGVIFGPMLELDDTAFVPAPVETTGVSI